MRQEINENTSDYVLFNFSKCLPNPGCQRFELFVMKIMRLTKHHTSRDIHRSMHKDLPRVNPALIFSISVNSMIQKLQFNPNAVVIWNFKCCILKHNCLLSKLFANIFHYRNKIEGLTWQIGYFLRKFVIYIFVKSIFRYWFFINEPYCHLKRTFIRKKKQ